jgi:hypothetical protein
MAGFQLSINGRFWVSTEGAESMNGLSSATRNLLEPQPSRFDCLTGFLYVGFDGPDGLKTDSDRLVRVFYGSCTINEQAERLAHGFLRQDGSMRNRPARQKAQKV